MADSITDNRTLVHAADTVTPYDDLSGAAAGTFDNEIFIQGSGSIGEYCTNSVGGILYDAGAVQTAWAGNHFYIWINCGIVGLLDTKANGGFRIRFAGATVSNFFEFYVGGSDSWPAAVSGGWVQFVVDIEATPSNTGGTPPATNAIRYVGWAGVTTSMPRMADNTWMDEIRRLPANTPGILVQGRNGGATPWTTTDIATQLGVGVGTFRLTSGGAYAINTPIRFGANDTTTHSFIDTNKIWLWANQEFVADDFYSITSLGGASGSSTVRFGTLTGAGDDRTGSQGLVVAGADGGPKWDVQAGANSDEFGLYGCTFINANIIGSSEPVVAVSSVFVGCLRLDLLNATSEAVRCTAVDSTNGDGVGFARTSDMSNIIFSAFEFSDGHAIELVTPHTASQDSKGNLFGGFGADDTNDAAIYNNQAAAVSINVTEGGDSPTVRLLSNTTVVLAVTHTITGLQQNTQVTYVRNSDGVELYTEDATTSDGNGFYRTDYTYGAAEVGVLCDLLIIHLNYKAYEPPLTLPSTSSTLPLVQSADPTFLNPV